MKRRHVNKSLGGCGVVRSDGRQFSGRARSGLIRTTARGTTDGTGLHPETKRLVPVSLLGAGEQELRSTIPARQASVVVGQKRWMIEIPLPARIGQFGPIGLEAIVASPLHVRAEAPTSP